MSVDVTTDVAIEPGVPPEPILDDIHPILERGAPLEPTPSPPPPPPLPPPLPPPPPAANDKPDPETTTSSFARILLGFSALQASGGVKRDPKGLKAMQAEYQRLVSAAGEFTDLAAGPSDDAGASRELKAVERCLASLKEQAEVLVEVATLQQILEDAQSTLQPKTAEKSSNNDSDEALLAASRALALLDQLQKDGGSRELEERAPEQEAVVSGLRQVVAGWRARISVGSGVDVYWEGVWYRCKVVEVKRDSTAATTATAATTVKIHFAGYKKTHQRWVSVEASEGGGASSHALLPACTHTLEPPTTTRAATVAAKTAAAAAAAAGKEGRDNGDGHGGDLSNGSAGAWVSPQELEASAAKAAQAEQTTNRFGRAVPHAFALTKKIKRPHGGGKEEGVKKTKTASAEDEASDGAAPTGNEYKPSDDLNDWFCSVCMAFEREDAADDDLLLACDGPCLRSFHLTCLQGARPNMDDPWLCEQCLDKEHTCFLCKDTGPDQAAGSSPLTSAASGEASGAASGHGTGDEEQGGGCAAVVKCSVARCGKFYHPSCVDEYGFGHLFAFSSGGSGSSGSSGSSTAQSSTPPPSSSSPTSVAASSSSSSFVCGHHECATCLGHKSSKTKGKRAHTYKCHCCPRAFHLNCVPPNSEFHEYCLVCSSCRTQGHELPPLTLEGSNQSTLGKLKRATMECDRLKPELVLHALKRAHFGTSSTTTLSSSSGSSGGADDTNASNVPSLTTTSSSSSASSLITTSTSSVSTPDPKKWWDRKHFRLDERVLKDVEARPPQFQHIAANQYAGMSVPKQDPAGGCSCRQKGNPKTGKQTGGKEVVRSDEAWEKGGDGESGYGDKVLEGCVCGDECENRLLRIECSGGSSGGGHAVEERGVGSNAAAAAAAAADGVADGGGGGGGNTVKRADNRNDKWSNCTAGPGCGNRQIGLKLGQVKVLPFMEEGMGWGLKLAEPVRAGQLVREYVGEVLTEAMLEERMEEHQRFNPNDVNMYVMELEFGLYLDARQKGNVSRFINHSCGPNCELQKWIVNGVTRIGIFATQDMPCGTSLSYDYQFSTNEHSRFRCKCGAPQCRGSLSSQGYREEGEDSGKRKRLGKQERKDLLKKAKAAERRDVERAAEFVVLKAKRQDLTAKTLPGDHTSEVRGGPKRVELEWARHSRLFLVRNATRLSSDFMRRKELADRANAKKGC